MAAGGPVTIERPPNVRGYSEGVITDRKMPNLACQRSAEHNKVVEPFGDGRCCSGNEARRVTVRSREYPAGAIYQLHPQPS
jgi:hypothetical protein